MNDRERFLATMNYRERDRCPWGEMGFWPETLQRWHNEGWPEDVSLNEFFGFDRLLRNEVGVSLGFVPGFKREILEESDEYRVVRRETGVFVKEFKGELSFHMPQWLQFPLKTRGDWENEIKPRLNPNSPERYPKNWEERVRNWSQRDYALGLRMGSIFGWLRKKQPTPQKKRLMAIGWAWRISP